MWSEPYNIRLSKRKKFRSLREVILDIIERNGDPVTPDQILINTQNYFLPFEPSLTTINNLLQKLARQNIIKFVYIDLCYGAKIIETNIGI